MSEYNGCHMYDENGEEMNRPATDVFEIEDFTAATEWENFMDQLENILRGWKLCGGRDNIKHKITSRGEWRHETSELSYLNFPFSVNYYRRVPVGSRATTPEPSTEGNSNDSTESCVMEDLSSGFGDFSFSGPIPSTLFGLTEFLVISPGGREILGNETRAGQIVGAVNVALHNTGCPVPVLIQVMEPSKKIYVGTAISKNCRTEFSSVLLNKRPGHVTHLTGLLQLFKNRISNPLPVEISPVTCSVRFSYELEDWAEYYWSISPPDLDLYSVSGDTDFIQLRELQFGCVSDPVAGLNLHTTWRDLSEELIVDNSVHSDLDPLEAPEWSISIAMQDKPECLLAKHVAAVLELGHDTRSVKNLLGDMMESSESNAENVSGLFDKLSGAHVSVSSYSLTDLAKQVRPLRNRTPTGGPLHQNILKFVLSYLFPDADGSSKYPYSDTHPELTTGHLKEHYPNIKSCPFDGLCWRLSTTVACCLGWAGAAGVAHLLHEFCLELRYRWENGILLPGIPPGPPDTGTSLLNQKLQMLNCCIGRRRSTGNITPEPEPMETEKEPNSDTDYEEEFFECEEEEEKEKKEKPTNSLPVWETAEGREDRVGILRLLNDEDWLYRPVLQEPAPLTEDQLAEQEEVLMQLGSDQAGSEVRAKLQSANLLSDMESFKAANPGCSLADFVRWHSPRDWEEGEGLSARMKQSGNMWTDLWEQSRAVPAHRQKRLFDETREAEKILQLLTNFSPGYIAVLVAPTLLQAAHLRVLQCPESSALPDIHHRDTASRICSMSKLLCLPEVKHYRGNINLEDFCARDKDGWKALELLTTAELGISRLLSLRRKFQYDLTVAEGAEKQDAMEEMERFIQSLCRCGEVRVPGAARGPAGRLIQALFRESNQINHPRPSGLPPPVVKQFTLRCVSGRPLPSSRPTPQRLYARFSSGEFRLTGAYTLDRQYL